jgi:putative methylase
VKKKELEILLQHIPMIRLPKPSLEQYQTPAAIAADILFLAYEDVHNKEVVDLGCGTGIFSIGCSLLGAKKVVGIDIDEKAIEIARRKAKEIKANVHFLIEDVKGINISGDMVIMNPPFGAQRKNRKADVLFLEKALEIAPIVYSIHLKKTIPFIFDFTSSIGGKITYSKNYIFSIKKTFTFHEKKERKFEVTMIRIVRA